MSRCASWGELLDLDQTGEQALAECVEDPVRRVEKMSIIKDAICWDGISAKLYLYVVSPGVEPLGVLELQLEDMIPTQIVGPYLLQDEANSLLGRTVALYELTLEAYPQELKAYLAHCSAVAIAGGAAFVWFALNGSFEVEQGMRRDGARDVYFLQPSGGVLSKAIDDEVRAGDGWAQVVMAAWRVLMANERVTGFEDLVAMKGTGSAIDGLVPVPHERLAKLRRETPAMPEQFFEFLRDVGYGGIGSSSYMIYDGLVEPWEVYSEEDAAEFEGILLFGDDFAGWNAGFDMASGRVVEIDSSDMSVNEVADDFRSFIVAKVSEIASW